ncbi:MAG: VOC family protein [Polyangiales bacterium]
MDHLTNWIEIPVTDMHRARAFYEKVLEVALAPLEMGPFSYAMFPARSRHNTGALVKGDGYTPSASGPRIYLDASGGEGLDAILARVTAAGGAVVMPTTLLSPEAGEVATFTDTEGNCVGLQRAVDGATPATVSDDAMQRWLGGAPREIAFVMKPGPAFSDPARQHLQWEHARNMFALLRAGTLRQVTAFMDGTEVLGLGVFARATRAEAEAILRDDPGVRGGRLVFELLTAVTFGADDVRG